MPINAHPDFFVAEKKYLEAQTLEEKIFYLEEMMRLAPKHKSSEKFNAELKTRLKKLKERSEKASKKSKGKRGIRKEGFQFVLIGFANSGKSSLLAKLTNARPVIAEHAFSTFQPEIGTFEFQGVKAQVIDQPSLGNENFDPGLANNADCLIYVIENFEDIEKIKSKIPRARGKTIIAFNKSDLLDETQKRKVEATIKSKRLNGLLVSTINGENIQELKSKLLHETGLIRVYMKEPGKPASPIPMVMPPESTVKDVAERILKGFSSKVKETRITGPSSKFPNQKVGPTHIVKDLDVVEFHTR
ncbi:MAG: 50S ribosome-binding GTPase [Nanoarchaeota archaeon]|nr:50S ribosome-binding GTPase [Nanoarchaeota archaeon]MBU0977432.1 50S ribosome-binding GTPase [Nanoarchaeota archaeon]